MGQLRIRPIDPESRSELRTIATFSLMTMLETIPELRSHVTDLPNFSIDEMQAMYAQGQSNPQHRYLCAVDDAGMLCGHAIFQLKKDDAGQTYGYCYTRYVLPRYRRRGVAARLLDEALGWFGEAGAAYALAHTHATNEPLRALFECAGFVVSERVDGRWPTLALRKELAATVCAQQ